MSSLSAGVIKVETILSPYLSDIVEIRAVYVPSAGTCLTVNPHSGTPNVTATFCVDFLLLILMLVGLWRMRDAGRFQLWRILLNQVRINT